MSDYKNRTRRVAICLITDENDNVLMGLRKDVNKWCVPGGHLELNEDPAQGALRELYEETGLEAEGARLVKAQWNRDKKLLLYLFQVELKPNQKPTSENDPDDEFSYIEYVDPNSVIEDLYVPVDENLAIKYWANN